MVNQKQLIFISGTGRSGTHLVGRSISSHPEITARIEEPYTFGLITRIATTQDIAFILKTFLFKILLKFRLAKVLKESSNHVLEKSHPSLWLVDFLSKGFKTSKFIFVYRDLEPTVSSMLEHKGVKTWYNKLPQNKINRFLGINSSNVTEFETYSLEEKCALRWKSHYDEIFRLQKKYPQQVYVLKYDDFLSHPDKILEDVSLFLNISNAFTIETFKTESLDKWKSKLNLDQLKRIRKIVM
ncbi:sulfotransferase family protein [Psychroserpens mesophilus]|uniref:sulfotransferase family protein n=1 Tax=Psychroserpens mesophilus TaxID=325473 RepID=UPI003D661EA7